MEARTVLSSLLSCGIWDVDFFLELLDTYDLDISDVLDDAESYL
jgi:hypothetical protein